MNNTFAIGIPTLNRYDLLKEALDKYYVDFPNTIIYIIDNGDQTIDDTHPNIRVYKTSRNLGVASSWNELCKLIYKDHSHALILNDDVILGRTEEEILNLINTTSYDFYVTLHHWCAFIMPKTTFDKAGQFDEEFFPAYYEDSSCHYRMKLAHCSYHPTEILNPVVFRNSMTIEKDSKINKRFEELKRLYIQMWGGMPGEEKYITKFNQNI